MTDQSRSEICPKHVRLPDKNQRQSGLPPSMAYREVTMVDSKEVLRLWTNGANKKRIAAELSLDVRRAAPEGCQGVPDRLIATG